MRLCERSPEPIDTRLGHLRGGTYVYLTSLLHSILRTGLTVMRERLPGMELLDSLSLPNVFKRTTASWQSVAAGKESLGS